MSVISILCLLPCLSSLPATSRLTQTASGGSEVVIPCSLQDTSSTSSTACHWVKDGWMVEMGGRFSMRSCQSSGGRPAPELEWWDEQTGERLRSEVTQHVERSGRTFR